MSYIQCSQVIPAPVEVVFAQLRDPANWVRLLDSHMDVEVIEAPSPLKTGSEIQVLLCRFGFSQKTTFVVDEIHNHKKLSYHQVEGIFKSWSHTMHFESHGEGQTLVTDWVSYSLPLGVLGLLANDLYFRHDLRGILAERLTHLSQEIESL